jgi:hypothetical protein
VLTNWLILPFECRRVNFSPEGERNLELKEVILLLAEGLNENVGIISLHCLVLEGSTARNVMAIGILDLNQYLLEILRPLKRWSHQDGLSLLILQSFQSRVIISPH